MEFSSVQMINGTIFDGKRIGELTEFIINKFSDENLTCDEAKIVLDRVKDVVGELSLVQSLERK